MQNKFDYIVVGSGAAGSALASRLSENDKITVAVLEAGGENINDVSRIQGAFFRVWDTEYNWGYSTTPQAGLNGRTVDQPRGRVMGGSTAINVGAWLRGVVADFDEWEKLGADGWNSELALRMFRKIEDSDRGPSNYRGKGGPMYMEDAANASKISNQLLKAFVETGFGIAADTNGEDPFSVSRMQTIYLNHRRRTAADEYLNHDVRKRKNLTIITKALVFRVLFEGNRAVAVEYERDGKVLKLEAAKEIILSAGAYNTPKILKLSGVGPKDELTKLGIPLVADVPGVGENLHDQLYVDIKVLAPENVKDSRPADASDEAIKQWVWTKEGGAIYYTGNTMGFTGETDKKGVGPDIELIMDYNHKADGKEPLFKNIKVAERSGYNISVVQLQPESRGQLTLKSKNPHDDPVINPNYFGNPNDIKRFITGFRRAMKLTKTNALKPYTEIVYPALDATDEQLDKHIRENTTTVFHPVGTAKIGSPKDPMAVLDRELKVRNVVGLRVADASAMPRVVSGHTMAASILIGERAAEIILGKK